MRKNHILYAADRGRTGTVFLPRDFKSLASACSATAADRLDYYTSLESDCQAQFLFIAGTVDSPELCRRDALVLFEYAAEIAAIVIADYLRYLIDGILILGEHQFCLLYR